MMKNKDVLFVVTSHNKLGDTGRSTGFYLSEASHPYREIVQAGFKVDFVSPKGGVAPIEGADMDDPVNEWFMEDEAAREKITQTLKPEEVDASEYLGIYFVGGHGTAWDFKDNALLQNITRDIYEHNGLVAAVCHGPIGLINVQLTDKRYLVDGKKMAAFSNQEEKENGTDAVVPFSVADKLRERGAKVEHSEPWQEKVITDGRLITGQNPASAQKVGEVLVKEYRKLLYVEHLR